MQNTALVFKNKFFIIAVSFVLVFALAACVFGLEYSSVVSKNKQASEKISALESQNNSLNSANSQAKQTLDELNKTVSDLNKKIDGLNSELSSIMATKASANSSKNSSKGSSGSGKKVNIDTSNLTAPNNGSKVCYLTFDDGPSDNTLKILEILKKANAKASFFVVGTSKLEYIKQIHAGGHTVALHTNSHVFEYIYKNEKNYFKDLNTVSQKVNKILGFEPKIIRFPGGSSNKVSKSYNKGIMTRLAKQVEQKGYTYVDWNVDSGDASGNNVPAYKLINNVISGSKNKGDICILMHDTSSKKTTVEALPQIICYLRAQGYRFEALSTDSPIFHHGINN